MIAATSHSPCWLSSVTAAKPSRAMRLGDDRRRQRRTSREDGLARAQPRGERQNGRLTISRSP